MRERIETMEKLIRADIDCLLNSVRYAINSGDYNRALNASVAWSEKVNDLIRVEQLREYSRESGKHE